MHSYKKAFQSISTAVKRHFRSDAPVKGGKEKQEQETNQCKDLAQQKYQAGMVWLLLDDKKRVGPLTLKLEMARSTNNAFSVNWPFTYRIPALHEQLRRSAWHRGR